MGRRRVRPYRSEDQAVNTLARIGMVTALAGFIGQWTPTVLFGWMLLWMATKMEGAGNPK